MIYALTGSVQKLPLPHLAVDVSGVAYLVSVPHPVWDEITNGETTTLIVYTFVREDRLELFGFRKPEERSLFTELLNISGIGPKIALELCSIPMTMLQRTPVQYQSIYHMTTYFCRLGEVEVVYPETIGYFDLI